MPGFSGSSVRKGVEECWIPGALSFSSSGVL